MNILIAPLNWGLGHASRSMPLIINLSKNHNIIVAADNQAFNFFKTNLPQSQIHKAPSLNIKYPKNTKFFAFFVALQIPKLLIYYLKNRIWLANFLKKSQIDLILSDNRFGFFSRKTKSAIICHHINIQHKSKIISQIASFLNKVNIEKFHYCLIPDSSKTFKISGKLSDTSKIKVPVTYIGLLSHLSTVEDFNTFGKFNILCLISGNDPQRSIFENILFEMLNDTQFSVVFVGGTFNQKSFKSKNIQYYNFVDTPTVKSLLHNAEMIIARSGYSTIMDLIYVQKTALLVPTPNQTEQEYLAQYLAEKQIFGFVQQNEICLEKILYFHRNIEKLQKNLQSLDIDFFNTKNIDFLLR